MRIELADLLPDAPVHLIFCPQHYTIIQLQYIKTLSQLSIVTIPVLLLLHTYVRSRRKDLLRPELYHSTYKCFLSPQIGTGDCEELKILV